MKYIQTASFIVLLSLCGCSDQPKIKIINSNKPKTISLPEDPPDFGFTDTEPGPNKSNRPAEWKPKEIKLGKTEFIASAGPYFYRDENNDEADYYCIDVEKFYRDASYVYFSRYFLIKDCPKGLLEKPIEDIVKFNEKKQIVTFLIGDKKIEYKLPNP